MRIARIARLQLSTLARRVPLQTVYRTPIAIAQPLPVARLSTRLMSTMSQAKVIDGTAVAK